MTIKFYLKHKSEPSLLSVRYRNLGVIYQASTGIKVDPKEWDGARIRVNWKSKMDPPDHIREKIQTNEYLDRVEHTLRSAHFHLLATGTITRESMRDEYQTRMGLKKEPVKYLIDWMDHLMKERDRSGLFRKGTIKVMNTARQKLYKYESQRGYHHTFDEINMDFFGGFMDFLSKSKFKNNYLNKIIRNIKVAMSEALERGLHQNRKFQSKRFNVPKEDVFNVYLNPDDLQKILSKQMSEAMERTRDLFLIGCYTGLRYGDIARLAKEHFRDGHIYITPQKDKKKRQLVIPCTPVVRLILDKYEYRLPKTPSNQLMNRQLKDICKAAEINDPVIKDGKTYQKYQLVSTHTARRSFATNAFRAGIQAISIMRITGHTTEQTFMKYIKISAEDNADLMSKNAFFTGMKAI